MAELTPEANRAARAILKWSVRELADKAGIAFTTVHRFETTGTATETTKTKIKAAYAAEGVEITNGEYTGARILLPKSRGKQDADRASAQQAELEAPEEQPES